MLHTDTISIASSPATGLVGDKFFNFNFLDPYRPASAKSADQIGVTNPPISNTPTTNDSPTMINCIITTTKATATTMILRSGCNRRVHQKV